MEVRISGFGVLVLSLKLVLERGGGWGGEGRRGPLGLEAFSCLWLVGNGRMVVIVVIIVPHFSIPY